MPQPPRSGTTARTTHSPASELLTWFDAHQRDLPWRRTRDPYAIWVSEVMLQQTQVETVIPFYERWLERFPTLEALASADEQAVLKQWQGLGYYARARRLLQGARLVCDVHGGQMPASASGLRSLPGIGPYSAGAIASIAYDQPEPLVDGNVVRVLTRLFAQGGDPSREPLKKRLWDWARELLPAKRPGAFNQALMELGATVCTPKRPACARCPWQQRCAAQQAGVPENFPQLPPRPAITQVSKLAVLAVRRRRVLVTQLPATAPRWAGMWWFPNTELATGEAATPAAERALQSEVGLSVTSLSEIGVTRHSITRYRVAVSAVLCKEPRGTPRALACADFRWLPPSELDSLPIPNAYRKVARQLLEVLQ